MKKILFIIIVIVFFVLAHNSVQHTISLWQKQHLVTQAEKELLRVKEENLSLKARLEEVRQPGFVEKEAREKLFYVKPGERIVFVPEKNTTNSENREEKITDPHWKQWMKLFF